MHGARAPDVYPSVRLTFLVCLLVGGCAGPLTAEKLSASREGGRSLRDLSNEEPFVYCRDLRATQDLTADEVRRGGCALSIAMVKGDPAACGARFDLCVAERAPKTRAVTIAECDAWSRRERTCDVTLADDAACSEELAAAMKSLAARGREVCSPPLPLVAWPKCDAIAAKCGQHPVASL
jgi:hypothetical protein